MTILCDVSNNHSVTLATDSALPLNDVSTEIGAVAGFSTDAVYIASVKLSVLLLQHLSYILER